MTACRLMIFSRAAQNERGRQLRQPPNRAKDLEPASSAIPTATADQQQYDDDDQKSSAVHIVLLLGDLKRRRGLHRYFFISLSALAFALASFAAAIALAFSSFALAIAAALSALAFAFASCCVAG